MGWRNSTVLSTGPRKVLTSLQSHTVALQMQIGVFGRIFMSGPADAGRHTSPSSLPLLLLMLLGAEDGSQRLRCPSVFAPPGAQPLRAEPPSPEDGAVPSTHSSNNPIQGGDRQFFLPSDVAIPNSGCTNAKGQSKQKDLGSSMSTRPLCPWRNSGWFEMALGNSVARCGLPRRPG